jgi:DpnII restriction endonuclease
MKKDFKKLTSTFKRSIKNWDYFVNWSKVNENSKNFEIKLNKLNYLLGKKNLKQELQVLLESEPDVVDVFPALLATRESEIEIYDAQKKLSSFFDFKNSKTISPQKCYDFIVKSGLIDIFSDAGVKNLVDYLKGVEVGLDSNGRKNRGGTIMENIVEIYINDFCEKHSFEYLKQANAKRIKEKWGHEIKINKTSRSFDFAVYNPMQKKLKLFETNFFNGGGSKLKTVCGDFKGLHNELKKQDIEFVWVTDGLGWNSTLRPLEEVYENNDYIFNLSMLEDGILSQLKW